MSIQKRLIYAVCICVLSAGSGSFGAAHDERVAGRERLRLTQAQQERRIWELQRAIMEMHERFAQRLEDLKRARDQRRQQQRRFVQLANLEAGDVARCSSCAVEPHAMKLGCDHMLCKDCLGRIIEPGVQAPNLDSLRCPVATCCDLFAYDVIDAQDVVAQEQLDRLLDNLVRAMVGRGLAFKPCPHCLKSCVYSDSVADITCGVCKFKYCGTCFKQSHAGQDCQQAIMERILIGDFIAMPLRKRMHTMREEQIGQEDQEDELIVDREIAQFKAEWEERMREQERQEILRHQEELARQIEVRRQREAELVREAAELEQQRAREAAKLEQQRARDAAEREALAKERAQQEEQRIAQQQARALREAIRMRPRRNIELVQGDERKECSVCCSDPVDVKLGCTHEICRDCLQRIIVTNGMAQGNIAALTCPNQGCRDPFAYDIVDIGHVFGENTELQTRYNEFIKDLGLKDNRLYRACPSVGCEYGVLLDEADADSVFDIACESAACRANTFTYCSRCVTKSHPRQTCEQAQSERKVPFKETDSMKQCPTCSTVIEKDGACNFMTCRSGCSVFCWYCKASSDHKLHRCKDGKPIGVVFTFITLEQARADMLRQAGSQEEYERRLGELERELRQREGR